MSLLWFLHMMAMPTGLQGALISNCLCTDQESLCVLLSWLRGTNPLCVALRRPSELTSWCCFLLVLWWDSLYFHSIIINSHVSWRPYHNCETILMQGPCLNHSSCKTWARTLTSMWDWMDHQGATTRFFLIGSSSHEDFWQLFWVSWLVTSPMATGCLGGIICP
jgi:hypothetical protein